MSPASGVEDRQWDAEHQPRDAEHQPTNFFVPFLHCFDTGRRFAVAELRTPVEDPPWRNSGHRTQDALKLATNHCPLLFAPPPTAARGPAKKVDSIDLPQIRVPCTISLLGCAPRRANK